MHTLITALNFAAQKHAGQFRQDGKTPYINHPIGVSKIITEVGVSEITTLTIALLHDTLEDTATTFDELVTQFNFPVAASVLSLTDDKSLPREKRKRLQIVKAECLGEKAAIVKIADKLYNIRDMIHSSWSIEKRSEYILWSTMVVGNITRPHKALQQLFDEEVEKWTQRNK